MLLAIVVCGLLTRRSQRTLPLTLAQRAGIALGAFVGATLGAKLPFALLDWDGLLSGRAWLENGKTIVFGLVGGYLGVEAAKAALDVRIKTGDSFAVPVAVAIAIGRWSCVAGGCCYGKPTALPWGIDFGDGIPRHPTQIYESAFHLTMAGLLAWLGAKGRFRGQLIKLYILVYLGYRILTEFLRPEPVLLAGLTVYQLASLALTPVFLWLWHVDSRRFRTEAAVGVAVAGAMAHNGVRPGEPPHREEGT